MALSYERRAELSLDILRKNVRLTRKSGSFLGQLICDPTPMTDKQSDWFAQLAERAGIDLEGGAK